MKNFLFPWNDAVLQKYLIDNKLRYKTCIENEIPSPIIKQQKMIYIPVFLFKRENALDTFKKLDNYYNIAYRIMALQLDKLQTTFTIQEKI